MTNKDISNFNLHGINNVSLSIENIMSILEFKSSLEACHKTYDQLIEAVANKYSLKPINGGYQFPLEIVAVKSDVDAIFNKEIQLTPLNFMEPLDFFNWIKNNQLDIDRIVALKNFLVKK